MKPGARPPVVSQEERLNGDSRVPTAAPVAGASAKPIPAKRFYTRALSAAERADMPVALDVEGLDEEIAVLRLRLRTALTKHPQDLPLMFKGIEMVAKAVAARYRLAKPSERQLAARIAAVLGEFRDLMALQTAEPSGDE